MVDKNARDYVVKSTFNAGFGHFYAGDSISSEQLKQANQDPDRLIQEGLIQSASDFDANQKKDQSTDASANQDYPPGVPRINSGAPDPFTDPSAEDAKKRNAGVTDKHPPNAERVEREHREARDRARLAGRVSVAAPAAPLVRVQPVAPGAPSPTQNATAGAPSASNVPNDGRKAS